VDSHTAGEATRLIVDGLPPLPGATMSAKLEYFRLHLDHVRLRLTREPCGHRDILAAALTDPVNPGSTFGLIYMDAHRYPFLCGHATIGAVATAVEAGWIEARQQQTDVVIDTPSGAMTARVLMRGDQPGSIEIRMVPSFVHQTGPTIEVPDFGPLRIETVCVGGFFAMASADQLPMALEVENSRYLVDLGMRVISAANRQLSVRHPLRPEVKTIDVVKFYDPSQHEQRRGSGAVIYGEGHLDRSPCGTGTAATLTLLHHEGRLGVGEPFTSISPLGTVFEARIVSETAVGQLPAVEVAVAGNAHLTGIHEFLLDPRDPLPEGYLL
jgi:proline racemase